MNESLFSEEYIEEKRIKREKVEIQKGVFYTGEWLDGQMDGYGVFTWSDGRKYEGEYVDDKKHGQGTYVWADGRSYTGGWKDGKQDGQGLYK